MKTFSTLIREKIKNLFLLLDYSFWLLLAPSKLNKIKKVLIIGLGAMGELLIMTSVLPALKKSLNCEISFMVSKGREEVLKNNPYVSEVLTYEESFKKNIKKLKNRKFNLAIDLFPVSTKDSLMCLFARIKYRIGGVGGIKGVPVFFFTRRNFPIIKKHVVEESLDVIRQIGIYNKNPKIGAYITKKEKQNVKNKLKKFKVKDYIIVHPGFGFAKENKYSARLWPLERYSKVIEYLVQNYPVTVLLTGLKDEKGLSEKIKAKIKNKKNVIITNGMFDYNELVALVSEAELVFCPDTLLVHIAASFNKKIVELMGNGSPERWHPWTAKENYRALFHPEVCTECYLPICKRKTMECLKAISVKEVINAINELLS